MQVSPSVSPSESSAASATVSMGLDESNSSSKFLCAPVNHGESNASPLFALYRVYCDLMEHVHPYQILYTVQQDLCGLRQCVTKGPNEDRTPPHRTNDYYAWMAWKRWTLMLTDKTWSTQQRFKEVAVKNYIATAHKYLVRLGFSHRYSAAGGVAASFSSAHRNASRPISL